MSLNSTVGLPRGNPYSDIEDIRYILRKVALVFSFVTFLVGIAGNSMVIWVSGFKLKATVTNTWLANLAVADFVFSLTQLFYIHRNLTGHWPYGLFLCQWLGFFKYANMFCSVFLLAVIGIDRALCIWQPIFMKRRRTLLAARVVAVCVWVASLLLSSPFFVYQKIYTARNRSTPCIFDTKYLGTRAVIALNLHRFLNGFLLPFIVILVSYVLAAIGLKRTRLVQKSRPLRISASLVIAFFVCWSPYHVLLLLRTVNKKSKIVKAWYSLASGLAYSNSCVNPILYFCMGLETRSSVQHSLTAVYKRALAEDMSGQTSWSAPCSSGESSGSKQSTEAAGDHYHSVVEVGAKI